MLTAHWTGYHLGLLLMPNHYQIHNINLRKSAATNEDEIEWLFREGISSPS